MWGNFGQFWVFPPKLPHIHVQIRYNANGKKKKLWKGNKNPKVKYVPPNDHPHSHPRDNTTTSLLPPLSFGPNKADEVISVLKLS